MAIKWRKSRSSATGNCVEVAPLPGRWLIRDSKLGEDSLVLVMSNAGFAAALRSIRDDQYHVQ